MSVADGAADKLDAAMRASTGRCHRVMKMKSLKRKTPCTTKRMKRRVTFLI